MAMAQDVFRDKEYSIKEGRGMVCSTTVLFLSVVNVILDGLKAFLADIVFNAAGIFGGSLLTYP